MGDKPKQHRARRNTGVTYRNKKDATHATVNIKVPLIVKKMYNIAREKDHRKGELAHLITDYMYNAIRETLGEAEYSAMLEYVDKYYPISKSPETKAYWNEILLGEKKEPGS